MGQLLAEVFVLGLVSGLDALAFIAVIVVSAQRRRNGTAFVTGWLLTLVGGVPGASEVAAAPPALPAEAAPLKYANRPLASPPATSTTAETTSSRRRRPSRRITEAVIPSPSLRRRD